MKYEPRQPREDVNYSKIKPGREAFVLVTGLLTVTVFILLITVYFIDLLIPHIPYSWENRILSGLPIPEGSGSEKHKPDTDRLETLLNRLNLHWPENPYEVQVGILLSDNPNALSLPGGRILISSALLEKTRSENELAFVLAHELGHFKNRDHLRRLGQGIAFGLLMAVIQGGSGSTTELMELAETLSVRKFSRAQEQEADQFALELVYKEYGHLASALDFFSQLPEPGNSLDRVLKTYLSSHPYSDDRIVDLENLAREKGWSLEGTPVPYHFSPGLITPSKGGSKPLRFKKFA